MGTEAQRDLGRGVARRRGEPADGARPSFPELSPGLYLVGTPIGNLDDWSPRARAVLAAADLVACEDTRVSGLLFSHFGISAHKISYHEHNKRQRGLEIVGRIRSGQAVALVSDAGLPAISDPGQELVGACRAEGLYVTAIPGPSAGLLALAASGLDSRHFYFEGFLPRTGKERASRIQDLLRRSETLIIYEAPHRLLRSLQDLATAGFARRRCCLARELTKRYEDYRLASVEELLAELAGSEPRGEYVLVLEGRPSTDAQVQGPDSAASQGEGSLARFCGRLAEAQSAQDLVRILREEGGLKRNQAYRYIEELKEILK